MFGIDVTEYDRKVWQEKLCDFLPDHLIDTHMHLWEPGTRKVGLKGCVTWTSIVAPSLTYEDMKETYSKVFPGKTVSQVLTGSPSCNLPVVNKYIRECADKYGHRSLYCTNWDSDEAEILKAMQAGFCGIKPYQNNSPSYIPANEVRIFDFLTPRQLELMNKIGGIVLLHIPRNLRLRDPINLAQMMEIDERYPNAKVIIAHVGRAYVYEDIGDAFEVIKKTKNLYYDFSANVYDYAMEKLIEAVGPKRVLYGSDMPYTKMRMYRINEDGKYINVVPRGLYGDVSGDKQMRETDQSDITLFIYEELLAFRRAAEKLGLTKEDVSDMMYGNAARYLNIK